ncbi:hexose transporter [Hyaloscypha variabilis F]|uniref:Hexose transporter n=1 Tax=Hyaloscypha variabilis (strain UAMH 11265 / GT02V1 / F) TaxID=1149755 RepID=A0A2J6R8W8_HYAVF|nr:hexose transporter [Hyaloscypha variabilis F]
MIVLGVGKYISRMVPKSSNRVLVLLILCASITSTTGGYDSSMMNGLNILPSYTNYFHLDTATLALNSSCVWAGSAIGDLFYGQLTNAIGRKSAMLIAWVITIVAVILQTAAQSIGMFVFSRFLIGIGVGAAYVACPTYLAEVLPVSWRGWGLGIFMDFFYLCFIGGLIAAAVTYASEQWDSTWAWRMPSAFQGLFALFSIAILPFIPESPQWLIYKGRRQEALEVLALNCADGDIQAPAVLLRFKEIVETLEWEKNVGKTTSLKEVVRTKSNMRRIMLMFSVAVITMLSGNNIVSYYLGTMLDNAGITNSTTQLQINVILNAWCLVSAVAGTYFADSIGRKRLAIGSSLGLAVFIFIVGALTAVYGETSNESGIYATVAAIFLFMGSYSFGFTPLASIYPPEVLNYSIRSTGIGVYQFFTDDFGLMATMVFPYAHWIEDLYDQRSMGCPTTHFRCHFLGRDER